MRRVFAVVLLLSLFAWAQSPFDGTWKIDASHAQFPQKPDTFVLQKGEYSCSTCVPKIGVKADGTDQKVAGAQEYDTLAVKPINDKAVQFTQKKDGKVVSESSETVSADGKTLTSEFKEYPPQGQPFTGRFVMTRVSPGPAGSHAISGTWKAAKIEDVSKDALTFTFKGTADGLSMKSGTGESYEATFDGKEYPVHGVRAASTVSLKKVKDNTIEETINREGKPFIVTRITAEGNTLKFVSKNQRRGTTTSFTAEKQ
jgi:hypothetical protein